MERLFLQILLQNYVICPLDYINFHARANLCNTEAENYRPISLLPLVSKIFEKIIHIQTQNFLDVNKILYKFQSGFRQNHSTDTSLSYLNDKILRGFDEGLFTRDDID